MKPDRACAVQRKTAEELATGFDEPLSPVRFLAARFGISDVALKKTCARAGIPTPDRGYWAKKDAGNETFQGAFPLRPPGMNDQVEIGSESNAYDYWTREDLLGPTGAPPEFSESIELVQARIVEVVGRVAVPRIVGTWHPAIEHLLKEDEKRRDRQLADPYPMSWNNPHFDTPFERRRLRILNSLFFAAAKMNGKPSVSGREGREIHISFFQQHFHFTLDKRKKFHRRRQLLSAARESDDTTLCLSMLKGFGSKEVLATWQDDDDRKLEACMTDVAVQLILTAEINYRENALRQYQWRINRKAELEEEEHQRKLEAERAEKEQQKQIEQGRVNRLLRDAADFQQAAEIRRYVEAIRLATIGDKSSSIGELERWCQWALAQADRIDPAIGGRFLKAAQEKDAS